MRFSSRFSTAIHIFIITQLTSEDKNYHGKITSNVIAEMIGSNPVTIRHILSKLKKNGLLGVPNGKSKEGITIVIPLSRITLYDVFTAVEPDDLSAILSFQDQLAQKRPTGQYVNETIAKHIQGALDAAMNKLKETTLEDVRRSVLLAEKNSPYDNPRQIIVDKIQDGKQQQ